MCHFAMDKIRVILECLFNQGNTCVSRNEQVSSNASSSALNSKGKSSVQNQGLSL